MSISITVGERLRAYRKAKGLSQETLAEYAGLHTTYIGQLERGEKNATIDSISKVANALGVSLSKLFENIALNDEGPDFPARCYSLIQMQSITDQEKLFKILNSIVQYKDT